VSRKSAKVKKARATAPKTAATKAPAKPRRRHVSRFLVLFRHGMAEDHTGTKPDGDRSLTEQGHAKTKRAARGLEEIFPEADALYSSPLVRAMQTALWLAKAYGEKLKVQVTDALLPGADPKELAELLASQEGRNVIVVGHEPNLTNDLAHFVSGTSSLRADLKKAGCIGIQLDEQGRGTLEWMLSPRMLRKLD
jgi:phosphohistidine phosphatase